MYLSYESLYSKNSNQYDFLIEGVTDLMKSLYEKGYYLGIATNKGSNIVRKQLRFAGLKHLFLSILGSDRVLKMKPHPEMILKNLGIINRKTHSKYTPHEVLMVGDGIKDDVLGGLRAGAYTCLVHAKKDALKESKKEDLPHLNLASILDLDKFL